MKRIRKPMKRGAVTTASAEMLAAWIPKALAHQLDTDRSKFLRAAIREHLVRVAPQHSR